MTICSMALRIATWLVKYAASRRLKSAEPVCRWAVSRRYCRGRSSSSSSYISSLMTSCSVTLSDRPVRRLWISDALRADSTLASRLLSLLLEAAMYALSKCQWRRAKQVWGNRPFLILFMRPLRLDSLCGRHSSCRRHAHHFEGQGSGPRTLTTSWFNGCT